MKLLKTFIILCFIASSSSCFGQTSQEKIDIKTQNQEKESTKQQNLLDQQTKMFGQIFEMGGLEDENPFKGAKNYLELIEKSEMEAELKKQLRDMYYMYDASLDPKKKDSLKVVFNKKLQKAIKKSQSQ